MFERHMLIVDVNCDYDVCTSACIMSCLCHVALCCVATAVCVCADA
jgi:hypothetical protein